MVRFKEYKRQDKIYVSAVEYEETKAELGSTFIVYPSLPLLESQEIPTVPRSDFASPLTTRVEDRTHDDIYLIHSASYDNSCTVTIVPLLRRKVISG